MDKNEVVPKYMQTLNSAKLTFENEPHVISNFIKKILRDMEERIRRADRSGHQSNFKSVLQQVTMQRELGVPTYHVLDEKGPDHAKCFEVCVELGGDRFPSCWAASKKQAEQDAALEALHDLGLAYRGERDEVLIRLNPVE